MGRTEFNEIQRFHLLQFITSECETGLTSSFNSPKDDDQTISFIGLPGTASVEIAFTKVHIPLGRDSHSRGPRELSSIFLS